MVKPAPFRRVIPRLDDRSDAARNYRKWYKTSVWLNKRRHQIRTFPFCKICLDNNLHTPATIADHVVPHRGDVTMFFAGDLQSLCEQCHSSLKQSAERHGYSKAHIDPLTGWPLDPNHPALR